MYYKKAISYEGLLKASKKCFKGIRWKDSVVGYEYNRLKNIYNLRQSLLNETYEISKYQEFDIYEPKQRHIIATRLVDRIFQRSLCDNGFYNDVTESFIADNTACQIGKGGAEAYRRIHKHLHRYYLNHGLDGYVLKCDIRHFFQNIDHDIAVAKLSKRCKELEVIKAISNIIYSFDEGIGLGSQISQLIALYVLDDLDHYIKEKLHIDVYFRTMDDFILIHPSKEYLKECLLLISQHLEAIGLELNNKTTINKLSQGFSFMKWRFRITDTGKVLMLAPKNWMRNHKRKATKLYNLEKRGQVPKGTTDTAVKAYCAYVSQGNSYKLIQNYMAWYRRLKSNDKTTNTRSII